MLFEYKRKLKNKNEVYLRIKATPGVSKTRIRNILSEEEETIKIDIAAAPSNGKANLELVKFLAKEFLVSKNNVKIISGSKNKIKLVKIVNR